MSDRNNAANANATRNNNNGGRAARAVPSGVELLRAEGSVLYFNVFAVGEEKKGPKGR